MLEKVKGLIAINRSETKNKWWHRLAKVIFYGGALVILISVPLHIYTTEDVDLDIFGTKITSFSFSSDFNASSGTVVDCIIHTNKAQGYAITCNGKYIENSIIAHAYRSDINTAISTDSKDKLPTFEEVRRALNELVNAEIENIVKIHGNEFSAKEVLVLHPDVFYVIGSGILAAITWIIILQLLYRIILYVIFGRSMETGK